MGKSLNKQEALVLAAWDALRAGPLSYEEFFSRLKRRVIRCSTLRLLNDCPIARANIARQQMARGIVPLVVQSDGMYSLNERHPAVVARRRGVVNA